MFKPAQSAPGTLTLIVATALSVLSLNMFAPALASIAEDLNAPYAQISFAISGYFALTALLQLIIGPLSDNLGRRPVMLLGVGLFVMASAGCALAPTAEMFLLCRTFQASVITGSVLATATVRDMLSGADATRKLGVIGTAMALGPMLGPFVGGAMDTLFGWRSVFWVYTGLAALTYALIWYDLGETNRHVGRSIAAQLKHYPQLLADRRFWAFAACNAISLSIFYSFILGAPLAGAAMGLSSAWIGVAMGATPMGYLLGNILTTQLARKRSNAELIVAGRIVTFLGMSVLLLLAYMDTHPAIYFALMISIGIGNGLTLPGAYAGAMNVRPDLAGSAAGMSGALNVGLGAVVTFLAGSVLPGTDVIRTLPLLLTICAGCALFAAFITRKIEQSMG